VEFSSNLSALRCRLLADFDTVFSFFSEGIVLSVALHTKSCAQTFPSIFGLFEIFDRNFAKLVEPSTDRNENYVVQLKAQSLRKKAENRVEIGQ